MQPLTSFYRQMAQSKKNTGKNKFLWKLIPALVIVLICSALTIRIIDKKRLQNIDSSDREKVTLPVKVVSVNIEDIPKLVKYSGVINAWQKAIIMSEVTGKVKAIMAKTGDRMEPGTPILKIDDELLRYNVEQARAHVMQLDANMKISTKEFERKKSLFADKIISALEFDIILAKEQSDEALLNSSKVALKIALRDLRETLITSPIKGILAERYVDIGTNVARGTMLSTVVDIEKIKINIGVSEKEIASIKEGQTVTIQTDAYPGEIYNGLIYSVGTKADDFTLSFPIEIMVINNSGPILKPGMTARIAIKTGTYFKAVRLPQESVVEINGQAFLWILNDNHVNKISVNILDIIGSDIIIKNDLKKADQIVVSGAERLFEGSPVQITNN